MVGIKLKDTVFEILQENQGMTFTARELAEEVKRRKPNECEEKRRNSGFSDAGLIDQLTREVYARTLTDHRVKSTADVPQKFYCERCFDVYNVDLIEAFKAEYRTGKYLESEKAAEPLYKEFNDHFSPEKLSQLHGEELLKTIFLGNGYNTMCYYLEHEPQYREVLGSIRGGSAAKYGLYRNEASGDWVRGSWKNSENRLSLDEAIAEGTQIRDSLVSACNIISNKHLETVSDYEDLHVDLIAIPGLSKNQWVRKYFYMMFPNLFTTVYSENWMNIILKQFGVRPSDNVYGKIGQMVWLAKEGNIPNISFAKIALNLLNLKDDKPEDDFQDLVAPSKIPLNQILYGAPGTGKTYNTIIKAMEIIDNKSYPDTMPTEQYTELHHRFDALVAEGRIAFVTFHQSYAYEEFVEGIKPGVANGSVIYRIRNGIFKNMAELAQNNTKLPYVLIIDEINRGNISKIFGELITLLEPSKRIGAAEALTVKLPTSGECFGVPNNLYVIGTMNTSDRSIASIDIALRRRFRFIPMPPIADLVKDVDGIKLNAIFSKLNNKIERLINEDHMIGHSFFMNCKAVNDVKDVWFNEIMPLMNEYFYGDWEKLKLVLDEDFVKKLDNVGIPEEYVETTHRFACITEFDEKPFIEALNKLA